MPSFSERFPKRVEKKYNDSTLIIKSKKLDSEIVEDRERERRKDAKQYAEYRLQFQNSLEQAAWEIANREEWEWAENKSGQEWQGMYRGIPFLVRPGRNWLPRGAALIWREHEAEFTRFVLLDNLGKDASVSINGRDTFKQWRNETERIANLDLDLPGLVRKKLY